MIDWFDKISFAKTLSEESDLFDVSDTYKSDLLFNIIEEGHLHRRRIIQCVSISNIDAKSASIIERELCQYVDLIKYTLLYTTSR